MNEYQEPIAYRKYLIISKIAGVQFSIEETPKNIQKVVDRLNREYWVDDFKAIRQDKQNQKEILDRKV